MSQEFHCVSGVTAAYRHFWLEVENCWNEVKVTMEVAVAWEAAADIGERKTAEGAVVADREEALVLAVRQMFHFSLTAQ